MKKNQFEYTRVLKLPPALGDWTTIQYQEPDEDIHITPVVNINFDSFPKDDLRDAHLVHYNFADRLANSLSKSLNLKVELHTVSASQMPYGDFLQTQEEKIVQADYVMKNLGRMNMIMDWELADMITDRISGGKGEVSGIEEFSDIELHMLHAQLQQMVSHYALAWGYIFKPEDVSMEFVTGKYRRDRKLTLREAYIMFTFYIHMGHGTTKKLVCAYQNSVLRRLIQLRKKMPTNPNPAIYLAPKTLTKSQVDVTALLGRATLTMNELRNLSPGDIVPLENTLDTPIEVKLAGDVTLFAQPGVQKKNLCVQLIQWDGVSDPTGLVQQSNNAELSAYAQAPLLEPEDPYVQEVEPELALVNEPQAYAPEPVPAYEPELPQPTTYEPVDLDAHDDDTIASYDEPTAPQPSEEMTLDTDELDIAEDDYAYPQDEEAFQETAVAPEQPETTDQLDSFDDEFAVADDADDDDDYSWDDLEDEF